MRTLAVQHSIPLASFPKVEFTDAWHRGKGVPPLHSTFSLTPHIKQQRQDQMYSGCYGPDVMCWHCKVVLLVVCFVFSANNTRVVRQRQKIGAIKGAALFNLFVTLEIWQLQKLGGQYHGLTIWSLQVQALIGSGRASDIKQLSNLSYGIAY